MKPVTKQRKYTLNQIGSKVDQIGDAVMLLVKEVKQINTRLDYVVKANNLKDLSQK